MIDYEYADLFKQNSVDKQITITSDDGLVNITNNELHQEEFELTESLCSESELTFGCCEAGMIKFKVSNVFLPMKGKWLTVKMTIGGNAANPLQIRLIPIRLRQTGNTVMWWLTMLCTMWSMRMWRRGTTHLSFQ